MAQAVSGRPPTAEARVRSRVGPCGICGGQNGTGTGLPRVLRFSPVNFIPPVPHYLGGGDILFLFISTIGLHSKPPQGCGGPVASAAGPFTKKKVFITVSVQNVNVFLLQEASWFH
jgi:hypothetical protein